MRLATNATMSTPRTLSGPTLGGQHPYGVGSSRTRLESALIGPYCAIRSGYGHNATSIGLVSTAPYASSCRSGRFAWPAVETAIYVR